MSDYSKDDIQKAIIAKYGSQKALSDEMGTTETALSNRIKRASAKFIKELEVNYGVDFSIIVKSDTQILLDRMDRIEAELKQIKEVNQSWQAYAATLLEKIEEMGIENKELRVQFFALIKKGSEGFGVNNS